VLLCCAVACLRVPEEDLQRAARQSLAKNSGRWGVGINQRVSLRKFTDDIRRWVDEGRSDKWIASALGTSPSSVQSFRSRNAIYRRTTTSTLYDPQDFSSYEGVLEPESPGIWFDPEVGNDPRWQKCWKSIERVELRLTPTRIVLLRRGGAGGPAATR
jgi:hypothetical protein